MEMSCLDALVLLKVILQRSKKIGHFQGCSRIKTPLQLVLIGPDETGKASHGWFPEQMLAVLGIAPSFPEDRTQCCKGVHFRVQNP